MNCGTHFFKGQRCFNVLILRYPTDFLSVGMIFPLLAGHLRELGASTTVIGFIGSIYGGVQLISSPLVGRIADRVGSFPCLLISAIMCAVGYCIVGMTTSVSLFAVGRFVLGGFKHGQILAKATLYRVLSEKEASAAVGRFHSFSNIGFILGPVIGGHIAETKGGVHLVSFCSAAIFLINAGVIWLMLPCGDFPACDSTKTSNGSVDNSSPISNGHYADHAKVTKENSFVSSLITTYKNSCFLKTLRSSIVLTHWDLMLINFLASLGVIIFRTNLYLNLKEKHGAGAVTIGYVTSFTATVAAIFGFCLGFVIKRYKHNEAKLFFHVTLLETASLVCLSLAPSIPFIIVFLTPLSLGTCISRVSSSSLLVNTAGKQRAASLVGWNQSILSLSRMLAPTVVGLIQEWSMDAAMYTSALVMMLSAVLFVIYPQDPNLRKSKKE